MTDWTLARAKLDAFLAPAETVAIVAHKGPDPDAIGSMLGAAHILRAKGKKVYLYVDGTLRRAAWLPGYEEINAVQPPPVFDRLLVLDCGEAYRLGANQELLGRCPTAVIDHHEPPTKEDFKADLRIVDTTASSTAEMLHQIFSVAPAVKISFEAATCIYLGLLADTLGFRSFKTGVQTFMTSAGLVALGANPQTIGDHLFGDKLHQELRLEGLATERSQLLEGGAVLYTEVTEEMLREVGATQADRLGASIPNILATVAGPKMFVTVFEKGPENYKLSVRTYLPFDSAAFCQQFGGNGHVPAAGVDRITGTLDEVRKLLFSAFAKEVEKRLGPSKEVS